MARHMLLLPVQGDARLVDAGDLESMAEAIGADWIERVVVGGGWSLAVDEEGALGGRLINPRASALYGTPRHGTPIFGDVLLGFEGYVGNGIDWVDVTEDDALGFLAERGAA